LFGLFGLVPNVRGIVTVGNLGAGFFGFTAGIFQTGIGIGAKSQAVLFAFKTVNKNPSLRAVGFYQQGQSAAIVAGVVFFFGFRGSINRILIEFFSHCEPSKK